MYARAVTLDLDTEMWDEIQGFGNSVKDQIAAFPGLISWVLVANRETGKGTSFSVFKDEEAFLSVNDEINRIVSDFGRFFVAPPNELLGDVLVHVDNGGRPTYRAASWWLWAAPEERRQSSVIRGDSGGDA